MLTLRIAALVLPALLLAAQPAGADEPPAEADLKDTNEKKFTPPPGFRARTRGEHTVYCRREEPKGTRFPTEVCYDQKGIREMLQTQREDQANIDQLRKTQAATF